MCVGKGNAFCAQLFACQLNQIVSALSKVAKCLVKSKSKLSGPSFSKHG